MRFVALMACLLAGSSIFNALLGLVLGGRALRGTPPAAPSDSRSSGDEAGRFATLAILKPLHGAEPGLEADLESVFRAAEAERVEIRMGIGGPDDGARWAAEAVARRWPAVPSRLAIGSEPGFNRKMGNVLNLARGVEAEVIVLADSDIFVPEGYFAGLRAALRAPGVGVVTCAYYGRPVGGPWSRIAAMGLSYQFLPSVLLGVALGLARPCMGSTIALRRRTLEAIGGFEAFRDVLADDYAIGAAVRATGQESRLAGLLVGHSCAEATLREVLAHELRWSRTIRALDPLGHAGSVLTHPLPLALVAAGLSGGGPVPLGLLVCAAVARLLVKIDVDRRIGGPTGGFWLLPLRDILSALVFAGSFFGRAVEWRGEKFHVTRRGDLRPV